MVAPHPEPPPRWLAPATPDPVPTGAWSDSSARAVLQLITESVAEMTGFEAAALSVVLGDQLITVAYKGPEELRDFLMEPDPVSILDPIVRDAEVWGRFRFLAEEDQHEPLPGHWAPLSVRRDLGPDSWRPDDALAALLTDDSGALVGMLSVDKPTSGLRPDAQCRDLLERYAAQTERAVITAFEREELVQQVAHAEAARRLIRAASLPAHASLEAVLSSTHRPLVEGFDATGSWIQLLQADGRRAGYARMRDGEAGPVPRRAASVARRLARRLWVAQRVLVIDDRVDPDPVPGVAPAVLDHALTHMHSLGIASVLAVPLGAGSECVGFLALTRSTDDPPWSTVEATSALQIGHDLGTALLAAGALEKERTLVRELQQLDDHRTQVIATLSHELRTPLSVITGNLEMLGQLELDEIGHRFHRAILRGADRMRHVVDDLLLLTRVSDPRHPLVALPVDLHAVAADVVELVESSAAGKRVDVRTDLASGAAMVGGDPAELDRLVGNLVSNAVKYTPAGGSVTVRTTREDDVIRLDVTDTGIGISEEDQVGLFRAFFRTTNPEALREPGTGLGLSIVASIAARHDGTVEVDSTLGEGTTFAVTLPALA